MFIHLPSLKLTAKARENFIFPCKYHQNGGFSMAMLVSGRVATYGLHLFPPSVCNRGKR